MKKSVLLVSLLLGVVACRRVDTIPTTQQIQSKAPPGALVRVILRDRANPQRVTTYTVDVNRNEIVDIQDRAPSATRGAQETSSSEEGTTSAMQQSQAPAPKLTATAELLTDCKPLVDKEGCRNVADLNDGDPRGSSGGGGDPTGHQGFRERILRVAALIYWSTLEVGIPTYNLKTLQAPPVDGPVQR
ncbi:hypothetical protein ACN469_07330 [Corallococcus terminator]